MRVSNRIVNLLYESSTKDDKIWKLIDKYEAGEMSKEEVEKEVKRLNKGNKAEIEADLALIFKESLTPAEQAEQRPDGSSEYKVRIENRGETVFEEYFSTEEEAIEYARDAVNSAEPGSIIKVLDPTISTVVQASKKDNEDISYMGRSDAIINMVSDRYTKFNESTKNSDLNETATYEVDMTIEGNLESEIEDLLKFHNVRGIQYKIVNTNGVGGGWPTVRFYGDDNSVKEFLIKLGYEDVETYKLNEAEDLNADQVQANEENEFDQIVLDSYNHLTNDLGKNPSLEDIVDDIINNYDQTFIADESPEDALQAIKDVRYILRKHDLTYDNLEESSTMDNDPDLEAEQVQADVDYWTDVDKSRTEDVSGREPVGVYTLSNTQAIYVYDIKYDIDDMVLAGDSSDPTKAKWRFINYEDLIDEETGETIPFFYYNAIKVPMNEVMRTNI